MARDATSPPPPPFLPPDVETRKEQSGQQVKIQIALFVAFLFFALILILGRLRSRGNTIMKSLSTYSFMITAYLVTYIPGLLNAPGHSSDLYVFWIAFIAYLAAVTNEISCYTLGDNEDRKKRLVVDYAVVWPLILTSLYKSLAAPEILVPVVLIFWIVVLKLRERSRALMFATDSSNGYSRATQIISEYAHYQNHQHQHQDQQQQPHLVLVGIREAQKTVAKQLRRGLSINDLEPSEFITLDKVMSPNKTFLVSSKVGKELQDTCASFAMFSTLLSKIAGYHNVDPRILRGAGHGGSNNNNNNNNDDNNNDNDKLPYNSFALVEKELDFLYEYFFTNYYAIYDRGIWRKLRDLCVITLFFWLTFPLLVEYRSQDHNIVYVVFKDRVLDTGFTRFVILAIITIEYAQIGVFLTSKWAKIMYTCSYLRNQTPAGTKMSTKSKFIQRVIKIAYLVPRPRLSFLGFTFTKRKVGQYSILRCYGKIPPAAWLRCWIGSYFELPRYGQAGKWYIDVSPIVQDSILYAIDNCLNERGGMISNGIHSLKENQVEEDVIETCLKNVPSQARIILIWHIATSMLEDDAMKTSPNSYYDNDFQLATTISKYTAYLVAFHPEMVPDHRYTTQSEFDRAIRELKVRMLEDDDEEDPRERLNEQESIFGQGIILKDKLARQPHLWRTLAQFWTEMLLFLAASDNRDATEAHANTLCVGGEFITHLWALVIHAGCSRDPII